MKKIRIRLKELMEERGLTQAALAEQSGLAPSTLGRFMHNRLSRIEIRSLERLAEFFNLESISDLIVLEDIPTKGGRGSRKRRGSQE